MIIVSMVDTEKRKEDVKGCFSIRIRIKRFQVLTSAKLSTSTL